VATYGSRVRYIREERKGLDIARNRALDEARNEIVALIDDMLFLRELVADAGPEFL